MEKTHGNGEMEIDLLEIFYALKKRALIIVAVLLAGAVLAGIYTRMMVTPVYRATSTMLVLTKETTLTSLADLQLGSQLTKDYSMLITSRTVLQEVIDELGVDMRYESLKEAVSINNPSDTRILELSVDNSDPQIAQELVNALANISSEYIGNQMEVVPPKVIEEAIVPEKPISPSMSRNVAMGALAGLVLAVGVVVLMTLMDDSIKSEDDIEKYLGLSTLAIIPDRKDYISGKTDNRPKKRRKRRKRK
ncbi:MAG TPA: polysaccharide export protein [Candidatus Mediterraneibacter intestinipullorum]|mgnify:CR=1 FL=1|nr:polysaccharide export protein [Candidatus Mediterraneibacter intestinipullorum]